MSLEPPPRIVDKFVNIWRDWLYFFWEFVNSHTGGSSPTPPTTGANWNAHGNDAVGGGPFTVDDDFSIPDGKDYEVNGVHVLSRNGLNEFTVGPNNTNTSGRNEDEPNIQIGSHLTSYTLGGQRSSVNIGLSNAVTWRNSIGIGISNTVSPIGGGSDVAVGRNNTVDYASVAFGKNNIVDSAGVSLGTDNSSVKGITVGRDNITSGNDSDLAVGDGNTAIGTDAAPALAVGYNNNAQQANCGAIGIGITNTIAQTLKIGPNNSTAILISGNGIGVALGDTLALARVHIGAGSTSVPSIKFEVSPQLTSAALAGAVEYTGNRVTEGTVQVLVSGPPMTYETSFPHGIVDGASVQTAGITGGNFTVNPNSIFAATVTSPTTFTRAGSECTLASNDDGTVEYTHSDNYIFFSHQDLTRSNIVTIHAETTIAASYDLPITVSAIICNVSSNAITVNLPRAASAKDRMVNVKGYISAGNQTLTVAAASGETIDKNASVSRNVAFGNNITSFQLISDGVEWWII